MPAGATTRSPARPPRPCSAGAPGTSSRTTGPAATSRPSRPGSGTTGPSTRTRTRPTRPSTGRSSIPSGPSVETGSAPGSRACPAPGPAAPTGRCGSGSNAATPSTTRRRSGAVSLASGLLANTGTWLVRVRPPRDYHRSEGLLLFQPWLFNQVQAVNEHQPWQWICGTCGGQRKLITWNEVNTESLWDGRAERFHFSVGTPVSPGFVEHLAGGNERWRSYDAHANPELVALDADDRVNAARVDGGPAPGVTLEGDVGEVSEYLLSGDRYVSILFSISDDGALEVVWQADPLGRRRRRRARPGLDAAHELRRPVHGRAGADVDRPVGRDRAGPDARARLAPRVRLLLLRHRPRPRPRGRDRRRARAPPDPDRPDRRPAPPGHQRPDPARQRPPPRRRPVRRRPARFFSGRPLRAGRDDQDLRPGHADRHDAERRMGVRVPAVGRHAVPRQRRPDVPALRPRGRPVGRGRGARPGRA